MNPAELASLKLLIRGSSDGRSRAVIFELPRQGSSQDNGPALLPVLGLPTNPNDCHRQLRPDLACKDLTCLGWGSPPLASSSRWAWWHAGPGGDAADQCGVRARLGMTKAGMQVQKRAMPRGLARTRAQGSVSFQPFASPLTQARWQIVVIV
jgi:hypothetical protein